MTIFMVEGDEIMQEQISLEQARDPLAVAAVHHPAFKQITAQLVDNRQLQRREGFRHL